MISSVSADSGISQPLWTGRQLMQQTQRSIITSLIFQISVDCVVQCESAAVGSASIHGTHCQWWIWRKCEERKKFFSGICIHLIERKMNSIPTCNIHSSSLFRSYYHRSQKEISEETFWSFRAVCLCDYMLYICIILQVFIIINIIISITA